MGSSSPKKDSVSTSSNPLERISTATVLDGLKNALSIKEYLRRNQDNMIPRDLSAHLMSLLKKKGIKRADVIRDTGLDKAYVYQIFDGRKNPSRDKLIAIAFGMHLNEEETQRTLKIAGYSELYPRVMRDAVILFAIQRGLDIWKTENLLYENGFPTLHPDE